MIVHTIDLRFQNQDHSVAAFLMESDQGLVLIETGPSSTFLALKEGIKSLGFAIENVKHVFLTHIHFDHAGAAWCLAELGAKIYVHPAGLPHLIDPSKLWSSAKQIYQDKMEELWGDMRPISEESIVGVEDKENINLGNVIIKVHYTPGHAVHHNAYQVGEVIFCGDVGGVKISGGPVVPPCPPPDINIELWKESIVKLKNLKPQFLYLTHFGKQEGPQQLLNELEVELDVWAEEVYRYFLMKTPPQDAIPVFMGFIQERLRDRGVSDELLGIYEYANPSWMSVSGLLRYWKLKEQGRI
jgi:glyoxylase-like metal-dependent hydrolase (beta-lactamase superfamily II)